MTVTASETIQVLTWRSNHRLFGILIDHCREVKRGVQLTRVPYAGPEICGIVNLRGEVITVYDLQVLLGSEPEIAQQAAIVRVRSAQNNTAIITRDVQDLVALHHTDLHELPANATEAEQKYIKSVTLFRKPSRNTLNQSLYSKERSYGLLITSKSVRPKRSVKY
jgi:purine-binding chemotaxis protein CheW